MPPLYPGSAEVGIRTHNFVPVDAGAPVTTSPHHPLRLGEPTADKDKKATDGLEPSTDEQPQGNVEDSAEVEAHTDEDETPWCVVNIGKLGG